MARRPALVLGWLDEMEESLRVLAAPLAELTAIADARWERARWSARDRRRAERDLVRRARDVPGLGELLEAADAGDDAGTPAWLGLEPRAEPGAEAGPEAEPARETDPADDGARFLPSVRRWRARLHAAEAVAARVPGASRTGSPDDVPPRLRIAERALRHRTRSLVPVLEDLVNPMNASAVIRTAEALGLQELHLVHREGRVLPVRSITKSSERWMDLHWWTDGAPARAALRARGYRVWAADFGTGAVPLGELPLDDAPVALVFGSEQRGVDPGTRADADGTFYLPTPGFASYLNVAAMAAIALHDVDRRLREAGRRAPLGEDELRALRRAWYVALAPDPATAAAWLGRIDDPPEPAPLVKPVPSREKRQG